MILNYTYEASTGNASPPEDTFSTSSSSCELNMMLPSDITSINYAIAVETEYDNGMPDMIYTNRFYISRGYTDLIQGTWYRDFVLDATNKGFVQGMGDGTFSPEGTLTRGQFLVMLLNAADINLDDYDEIGFTNYENSEDLSLVQSKMPDWVRKYMNYALKNLIIDENQYIGDIEIDVPEYGFEQELNRAETAYILYMMFIGNLESIKVPSNIYFYDGSINNYKTELWSQHRAFAEQREENSALNNMNYVQQMYYNSVLDGMPGNADEGDDLNKIYFYPDKTLTRAEACKVVLKCLFELNDDIPEIQANIFEDDVISEELPNCEHGISYVNNNYNPVVYELDKLDFNATNQIVYTFKVNDDYNYAIETTGDIKDGTTWGRLYCEETNEKFDDEWILELDNINYNSYENSEDRASRSAFEDFLGTTNMQGYGVTFVYKFKVHNLGTEKKQLYYYAALNRGYHIDCYVNGKLHESRPLYEGNDEDKSFEGKVLDKPIDLSAGAATEIEIRVTEFAGANATMENWFKINNVGD